jgi:hypothetical protein
MFSSCNPRIECGCISRMHPAMPISYHLLIAKRQTASRISGTEKGLRFPVTPAELVVYCALDNAQLRSSFSSVCCYEVNGRVFCYGSLRLLASNRPESCKILLHKPHRGQHAVVTLTGLGLKLPVSLYPVSLSTSMRIYRSVPA